MSNRFWLYLGAGVIILGLYTWRVASTAAQNNQISHINQQSVSAAESDLTRWTANQTDSRKLVSLAKLLKNSDPDLLKIIIDRAYALNPNSRDITLLASQFHPELKAKVLVLDPLYKP